MFRLGDIYSVSLEPIHGHEQAGHRPVLVISADAFNTATRLPIVLPITSGGAFARNRGFTVALPPGLKTTGWVLCNQPRSLDLVARGATFRERANEEAVLQAIRRLLRILSQGL